MMKKFVISEKDLVVADLYSEQIDLMYTVSGITLEDLVSMLKADKHIYLQCLECELDD